MKKDTPEYTELISTLAGLLNDQSPAFLEAVTEWLETGELRHLLSQHKGTKAPLCTSPSGRHCMKKPDHPDNQVGQGEEENENAFLQCIICDEKYYLVSGSQLRALGLEPTERTINSNN